ncbi:sensor histidine kinase [Paenibacillus sp. N1-5-1-14]|uniref:sensor histidine kinase n=1 Tax=Paenibacillus radicibacter TaxID=2972488 RepID=UPI002158F95D|nr:sensor histidine kinase [Paenibacillus radicibacter]MCR8642816.1 sensor histidine kinase [Paenibacillus radicibacter]
MKSLREKFIPASEGIVPLVSLANLLIPILILFLSEPPLKIGIGLVLMLMFIMAYREQYWRKAQALWFIAGQLLVIVAFMFFYHPVYAYMGFLVAMSLSKQNLRFMQIVAALFALIVVLLSIPLVEKAGLVIIFVMLPPLFGVSGMPFIVRGQENYKLMAERLKAATEQLERMAQQEERQRIARELHDTLGHTMSLLALKGELTSKLITRAPEKAQKEAQEITETARAALKQMRELVTTMRVVRLEEEYTHATALCAAAGIKIKIEDPCYMMKPDKTKTSGSISRESGSSPERLPLSPLQETILAMCFRESLTNAVRHSRASSCTATLEIEEGLVRLTLADDGVGLDQEQLKQASGSGIAGLKQRLALVDGYLNVESEPGQGLKLALHIPRTIRSERAGAAG